MRTVKTVAMALLILGVAPFPRAHGAEEGGRPWAEVSFLPGSGEVRISGATFEEIPSSPEELRKFVSTYFKRDALRIYHRLNRRLKWRELWGLVGKAHSARQTLINLLRSEDLIPPEDYGDPVGKKDVLDPSTATFGKSLIELERLIQEGKKSVIEGGERQLAGKTFNKLLREYSTLRRNWNYYLQGLEHKRVRFRIRPEAFGPMPPDAPWWTMKGNPNLNEGRWEIMFLHKGADCGPVLKSP